MGNELRIVSLLASATEIVCGLGLADALVGISHECDHPPEVLDRPRVSRPRFDPDGLSSGEIDRAVRSAMAEHGSVYEVDGDLLERLEPDLILTQAVCEVCAVPTPGVRDELSSRGMAAQAVSLDAHSLDGILESVRQVGAAAERVSEADHYVARLRERIERVRVAVDGAPSPRVLGIEWLDPVFAPGHWVPEMIELAGGQNLLGSPRERSHEVEWSALEGLDPDVLVVMPCGYGLEAARSEADAHADRLMRVAGRAVSQGSAFVVDSSSYFNRSGPRVVEGIEILAGIMHRDRFPVPAPDMARTWRP